MKDCLHFSLLGDVVRDTEKAATKYSGQGFPYELCVHGKDQYSTGRVYWEVGLKLDHVQAKRYWLIGVAKAPYAKPKKKSGYTPSNGFWFLCSDPEKGLFINTVPDIAIKVNTPLERVGVLLDFDKKKLAFYNAVDGVRLYTIRNNFKNNAIVPLFNPGIGDNSPLKLINPQSVPDGTGIAQASDANQHV